VAPAEEQQEESTQPTRQVEATTESQLPFTGFAAIPVMLGGIALLTGGLVLRRRTRAE
jgi:LPXTG-motif cell wall-anchored protein